MEHLFLITIHVLIYCLLFNVGFSQEVTLSKAADKIADEVYKKHLGQIGSNKKIAVCFFLNEDTLKTKLGIKLTEYLVHSLNLKMNNTDCEVLFPDNIEQKFLSNAMWKFFTPPSSSEDENVYWTEFNNNKRPDYWLTGKYKISDDKEYISINNVYLKLNEYVLTSDKKKSIAVDDIKIFIPKNEKLKIAELNRPINSVSNDYLELINLKGSADLFTLKIVDYNLKKTVDIDTPLKINSDYQIEINLKEDAFLYAFFYDSKDENRNLIDVLFPLDNTKIELMKSGIHLLPEGTLFSIDPPEGDVYIKIIAVKKLIPLEITKLPGKDGYTYTCFYSENCRSFLNALTKLPKNDYDTKYIIKKVVK